jgi:hypothetical protein
MTNRVTAKMLGALTVLFATVGLAATAHAVPALQVYVEGAVYDTTSETWVLDTSQSGGTVVITATNQNGKDGDLYDMHMVVSALQDTDFSATLRSENTSTVFAPSDLKLGSSQTLKSGGDATNAASNIEFNLGDFTGIPKADGTSQTYVLTLTNLTGTVIIDAYAYTDPEHSKNSLVFAPYSHNGSVTLTSVPELSTHGTGTAAVLLTGVALVFGTRRRRTQA